MKIKDGKGKKGGYHFHEAHQKSPWTTLFCYGSLFYNSGLMIGDWRCIARFEAGFMHMSDSGLAADRGIG